jgi:hypothetical protein
VKYTITVLGQDDPDALRAFITEASDGMVTIEAVLDRGSALDAIVPGSRTAIHQLCIDLITDTCARKATAHAHPPVI